MRPDHRVGVGHRFGFDRVGDLFDFIKGLVGAKIDVQWTELEAAGISGKTLITLRYQDDPTHLISVEQILRSVTASLTTTKSAVSIAIDGDRIIVSTQTALEK